MDSTTPGRSALTVTPRTAATVPMAVSAAGHSSRGAVIVVTASGGGWNDAAMAIPAWIWRNFTPPITARKAATATSITTIRFLIRFSF